MAPTLANREIDSRSLGGDAEVTWLMYEEEHFIFIIGGDQDVAYCRSTKDATEAREMFKHPFVDRNAPDIF